MESTSSHGTTCSKERTYVKAWNQNKIDFETDPRTGIRKRGHSGNRSRPLDLRVPDAFWSGASFNAIHTKHRAMAFRMDCKMAMFADLMSQPSSPESYPTPTYGAIRQILQGMTGRLRVNVIPLGIEIIHLGTEMPFGYNLTGPGRKPTHHKKNTSAQFHPIYRENCSFKVFFALDGPQVLAAAQRIGRRIKNGNGYVFAGNKELPADLRAIDPKTDVTDTSVNFHIPVMMKEVVYEVPGAVDIYSNVRCENGRLLFPREWERMQQVLTANRPGSKSKSRAKAKAESK
jgi:hypothetical protein